MKHYTTILSLALVVLTLSACTTQRFIFSDAKGYLDDSKRSILFVGGIAQTDKIDLKKECGGVRNLQSVEFTTSFSDSVIAGVSDDLVTPRSVNIYCKK